MGDNSQPHRGQSREDAGFRPDARPWDASRRRSATGHKPSPGVKAVSVAAKLDENRAP